MHIQDLRDRWSEAWGKQPHARIGRTMLEKSLAYKTSGKRLTPEQQVHLNQLIKHYKRNQKCFDKECVAMKPGMRLIRNWKGTRHSVLVKSSGFEYQGQHFTSLTKIANDITGSRWNGRVFFGLNKKDQS